MAGKIDAGYITIEFSPPIEKMIDALNEIDRDLSNMRTPLRESVQRVIMPSIDANFAAGGRPPWTPLAESTLARRARQGTGATPLQVTGKLRRAATQFSRWDVGTQEARITNWPGDVAVRAGVQNFGASNTGQGANIPAREFLAIQESDAIQVDEIFLTWMERRAGAAWSGLG